MATSGVNVLRWSALFSGIAYGIYHQSSLRAHDRANEANRKFNHEESLIKKAKAEYLKKTLPQDKLGVGNQVISNPDDPKFDLEAFLKMQEAKQS